MGKTFALRVLALGAALDPAARLRIWELKGTGDLAALKHVAHEYGSGADDDTLRECLESVRKLHAQLDIRAKTLRELPDEVRPENKVTPQLCARRGLGLFPEVLIIDECQEAYSSSEYGKEFDALTTAIIKRGPALGIMLILATQRPDAASLPKSISANIGIRYCLRMMGTYENNAVLGPGMYARGIRATDFALSDKGIGWLAGHADDPEIVRGCYIDAPAADTIARRARDAREAAGTLSGFALGEDLAESDRDFLADVLSVFGPGEANLWCETIAARLAGQLPGAYEAITQEAVASQLRAKRVTVKSVRETGKSTRSGCVQADVEARHA
jgi:S-DNA-T family DNA segregation ATPase FtsK/SpoIIIE